MTALAQANDPEAGAIMERVLMAGDLSKLSPTDRMRYYTAVCESVGVNPLTRPFEFLTLNGKLTLYARKDCTDQLRKIHGVNITSLRAENVGELYVVTAQARTPDGRCDEELGAVSVGSLKGEALANAMMKCSTKAKRRVTLSLCGLGLLDETEIESIPPGQREAFVEHEPAVVRLATAEQVEDLKTMLMATGIAHMAAKWLKAAGVKTLEEMSYDKMEKCLAYARDRHPVKGVVEDDDSGEGNDEAYQRESESNREGEYAKDA